MTVYDPRPIVTLTTDFGTNSSYVGQMKGVLLARNPNLQLVDISHEIAPQDIQSAALVVDDVCRLFPPRTIHVVVVDPGVGTARLLIFAKLGSQRYVAPDNGVLTLAARRAKPELVISLTNRLYFLPEVSATFHGRDILVPVAAHLSLGLQPERLGDRLDAIQMLPLHEPRIESQCIVGTIWQIDSFGNVITNIAASQMTGAIHMSTCRVHCATAEVEIVRTYGDKSPGTLVALIGSSGRLEIACVNGRAAQLVGAAVGDEVRVTW